MASIVGTPAALDETTNNTYTPETGSNRLVVAAFVSEDFLSRTITSVTLGGVSMTSGYEPGQLERCYIQWFYLKEADIPVGSSAWAVTWSGAMDGDEGAGVIFTLQDVDQTTPIGRNSSSSFSGSTTPSDAINSLNSSVCIGILATSGTSGSWTGPTGSFTQQRQTNDPGSSAYRFAVVSKAVTTAASESWGYTLPVSLSGAIGTIVVQNVGAVALTDIDTDEDVYPGQSTTWTGVNFEATQATGGAILSPTDDVDDANAQGQTETAWADTSLTVTIVQGGLPYGNLYAFVKNDSGDANATGLLVTLSPASGTGYNKLTSVDPEGIAVVFTNIAAGDQVDYDTTSSEGGTVSIAADGTVTITNYPGDTPASDSFGARGWDATDYTWTATTTVNINEDAVVPEPTDYDFLYEITESSGSILTDASANGNDGLIISRLSVASTSAGVTDYQGYSTDGTNHYTIGTAALSKYNSDYSTETATNATPFASLIAGTNHLGDGQYYNSYLYVVAENYTSCGTNSDQQIVLYNASDLTYSSSTDISAQGHEAAGIAIDSANNHIYIVSYCDSTQVFRYNLTTHAYIDAVTLDVAFPGGGNGIYCDGTYLYIASHDPTGDQEIYKYTLAGALAAVYRVPTITEIEGIDYSTGVFRYNSYPEATIKTANATPADPALSGGVLDLDQTHYVKVPVTFADEGTIVFSMKAGTFFDYNAMWDFPTAVNDWESWIYATGQLAARITQAGPNAVYTLSSATTYYKVAFSWSGSGATRTVKLYVDDVLRDTETQNWTAPASYFYIGGGNPTNSASDATFEWVTYYPRELSLSEIQSIDGSLQVGSSITATSITATPITATPITAEAI